MRRGGQDTDPQRGDCVKTQGEDGCPQPRREALGETSPCQHLDLGPCSPQNFEKMNVCVGSLGMAHRLVSALSSMLSGAPLLLCPMALWL